MSYIERLTHYAKEKRELDRKGLAPAEYEAAVKALSDKWRI